MNPYDVLELLPGASTDDIKSAYHRLAKQWHPDRFSGQEKATAETRFRELAEAFTILKDPARRMAKANPNANTSAGDSSRPQTQAGPTSAATDRSAEDWFKEAKEAFAEQHLERALGLVQVAIRQDPRQAGYHVLYAELLMQTGAGDSRLVVKALETALRIQPKHADACILLAGLYEKQAMPVRAQKLLQTAREIAPNHKFFRQEARKASAGKAPAAGVREQVNSFFQRIFNRG